MQFELLKTEGRARRGRLVFERGVVETPAFMPVGTYGTVKGMTPEELKESGAHICLGNTFHLMLRPGTGVIRQHGDLHDFMNWDIDKINVNGGAISIGHPIGASGARILVSLLHEMKRQDAKKGLATLCIGGGMGIALALER